MAKKQKRIRRKRERNLKAHLENWMARARMEGFKSVEECILYHELEGRGIRVKHNVHLRDTEIDLFLPPDTVIEEGHRDSALMRKWDEFENAGFTFFYFSNIEIRHSMKQCLDKILSRAQ